MKHLIASGAIALSLLSVVPAFADSGEQKGGLHLGLGISALVRMHTDNDNDRDSDKGKEEKENHSGKNANTAMGTVASMNGSTFIVDSFGKSPTTTVTTSASTVFKLNGVATTSAALTAGAHVIVIGTTTATSTSGNAMDASVVIIFTKMFGFFKHWMHVRA